MINLTETDITLIAESGEVTTIPASGYVARVETKQRAVSSWHNAAPDQEFDVPIIEETPAEIVVNDGVEDGSFVDFIRFYEDFGRSLEGKLFLVTREVAEAAATLKHPLAARMVWAADKHEPHEGCCCAWAACNAYHSLRRVPQVSHHG